MTTRVRFATWAALAGALAVLVAGLVAIVVVERSLHQVIDDRISATMTRVQARGGLDEACRVIATLADDPSGRVASIAANGTERCRSSQAAPSPRALGLDVEAELPSGIRSRSVEGVSWRIGVMRLNDRAGAYVIVGEQDEPVARALRNAQRAIFVAIAVGILLAIVSGVVASIPATRRIRTLLDRIRRAAVTRRGDVVHVAGGLGRDLDRAGRAIDELLDQLRDSEAARHRLFADAAHQLRTPVTSIRTNAQLLERRSDLDDDARDIAARIAAQSASIGALVSALVDYAAVEAWIDADAGPRPLGELAREAMERATIRWPDLDVALHDDGSAAVVDSEQVVRAVGNLIDNAMVHGRLPVTITVADDAITVADAGDGLDGLEPEAAFEPFASGGDGSGLGLAFVAHVARVHGGDARIEPGPGTRVTIDLARRNDVLG
ncbi:MAG: HAMP domain-containing histidine kinase [Thermoleophilia bacterium]|nr:HAMP domain-containing histidine kinase [Thermoleophilia bacterium]